MESAQKLFVFGYKVVPALDNPEYLKVSFAMAAVWVIHEDRDTAKLLADATLIDDGWQVQSEVEETCGLPEQLRNPEHKNWCNEAFLGPKLLLKKVAPGETQPSGLN